MMKEVCVPGVVMSEASKTTTRYAGLTNRKSLNAVEGVEREEKDERQKTERRNVCSIA